MDAIDAVEQRFSSLFEDVPADMLRVGPGRIELDPFEGGLPVCVEWSARGVSVWLCDWRHEWSLEGDDGEALGEALDLVAAALFGYVRVRLDRRGASLRGEVEVLALGSWTRHASFGRIALRDLWRRRSVELRANGFAPPPTLALGRPGSLPFAPWVGMLAQANAPDVGELEVDGVLDLHPFSPKEVAPLVRAYIDACVERGITELRIIHGKGIGHLRRTVHALLAKHPAVAGFRLGGHGEGSWGATIVDLRTPSPDE